jgi:hypothetical protein
MGGLRVHDQPPDPTAELGGYVLLHVRELDEVAVGLLAEVEAVCVDDELERAARAAALIAPLNGSRPYLPASARR